MAKPVDNNSTINCSDCSLGKLCYPEGLDQQELLLLDQISSQHMTLKKGGLLIKRGEPFNKLYTVRLGSFKAVTQSDQGEKVVGYYLPGEVIGLDAVASQQYTHTIIALEQSYICTVVFDQLFECSTKVPNLQKRLLFLMSQHITAEYGLSPSSSAKARVAYFLLDISKRYKKRGFSEKKLTLTMSREDIGCYLGLATETISRMLSMFQAEKIIQLERRHITILDRCALESCFDDN